MKSGGDGIGYHWAKPLENEKFHNASKIMSFCGGEREVSNGCKISAYIQTGDVNLALLSLSQVVLHWGARGRNANNLNEISQHYESDDKLTLRSCHSNVGHHFGLARPVILS